MDSSMFCLAWVSYIAGGDSSLRNQTQNIQDAYEGLGATS
jgi:hypothetical protein